MDLIALGRALKSASCQRILSLLHAQGPLSISDLASQLGVTPGTICFHVDRLEEAGLVEGRRKGKRVMIRLLWRELEVVGVPMS